MTKRRFKKRVTLLMASLLMVSQICMNTSVVYAEENTEVVAVSDDGDSTSADDSSENTGDNNNDDGENSDGENPDGENPDGENPDGENPDGENPDGENPDGENPDGENPDGENPDGENPDGENPDGENPDGENPDGENPDGENPDGENPDGENPDGENPDGENPDGENPDGENPDENLGNIPSDESKDEVDEADEAETIDIVATVTWDDNENLGEVRPSETTIYLYVEDAEAETDAEAEEKTAYKEVVVTGADNWEYTFNGLPKYAASSEEETSESKAEDGESEEESKGKELIYSVSGSEIEDYEITVEGYNVTYTYVGATFFARMPQRVAFDPDADFIYYTDEADKKSCTADEINDVIKNAESGTTFELGKDVKLSSSLIFDGYKSYTLDLKDHTLTGIDNQQAVLLRGRVTVTVKNGTITGAGTSNDGNWINSSGAGINIWSSTLIMDNVEITDNTASLYAGGIFAHDGTITVTNSTISNNVAGQRGSGIYLNMSTMSFENCEVSGNENFSNVTGNRTAGIFANNSTITADNLRVVSNGKNSEVNYGGIYISSGSMTLNNSLVADNYATYQATGEWIGGISIYGSTVILNNTDIKDNYGLIGGVAASGPTTLTVSGGAICNNEASEAWYNGFFANDLFLRPGAGFSASIPSAAAMMNDNSYFWEHSQDGMEGTYDEVYTSINLDSNSPNGNLLYNAKNQPKEVDGVFVNGINGDDTNSGVKANRPVKTFARAKEVYEGLSAENKQKVEGIWVTGTIMATTNEEWSLPEGVSLLRYEEWTGYLVDVKDSELTLRNITVNGQGDKVEAVKAAIRVSSGGTLNIEEGTKLINNRHSIQSIGWEDGGAIYCDNGRINMSGGEISGNTGGHGGGIKLTGANASMELNGGAICNNTATKVGGFKAAGGGIVVAEGATLTMNGGEVFANKCVGAGGNGGGIAIGIPTDADFTGATFIMNGGKIYSNTADVEGGCGGGVYVECMSIATLKGGELTNNSCGVISGTGQTGAYGGGGIYVNGGRDGYADGKLYIPSVYISGNTAEQRDGSGIAGCGTSTVYVYPYSATIYQNNGSTQVYVDSTLRTGYGRRAKAFISEFAQGDGINYWVDANGEKVPAERLQNLKPDSRLAIANPNAENLDTTGSLAAVKITGNISMTLGGGIGTNGYVQIGSKQDEPKLISIKLIKEWNDDNDRDGIRPSEVTVPVYANGEFLMHVTITEADGWEKVIDGLPNYDANGKKIDYTAGKDSVEGYTCTVDGYKITNTHTPETVSIKLIKEWDDDNDRDGIRPSEVTVPVYANGEFLMHVTITEADGWEKVIDGLPKYDANGKKIDYTAGKDSVKGYTCTVDGYKITNKHVPKKPDKPSKTDKPDKPNKPGLKKPVITERVENTTTVVTTQTVMNNEVQPEKGSTPKTGEDATMIYVCTVAIVACVAALFILRHSKKRNDNDNNK